MSEDKPLPCPFCLNAPRVYESEKVRQKRWFVTCDNCDCLLMNCRGWTRGEVVSFWNNRAPATDEQVAAAAIAIRDKLFPDVLPSKVQAGTFALMLARAAISAMRTR